MPVQHGSSPLLVTLRCCLSPKYSQQNSLRFLGLCVPKKYLTPRQPTENVCRPDGVTGYIRVVVFSQNAAADVQHAVQELTSHVCQSDAVAYLYA